MINFPTSLDNFTNPTPTSDLTNPSHSQQHSDINDSVEALQTKVGIDGSSDINSLDYKVSTLETDVTTLQSDLDTAEGDIITLQSDVSTLESDVSTLQSTAPKIAGDYANISSTFTSVANTTEQDVTGSSITVTGLGSSQTVYASCNLTLQNIPAGNTNIRLYIDGDVYSNYYSSGSITGPVNIALSGIGTVADGLDFIVKVSVQNDASNQLTVFGATGNTAGRSQVSVLTFTNGQ